MDNDTRFRLLANEITLGRWRRDRDAHRRFESEDHILIAFKRLVRHRLHHHLHARRPARQQDLVVQFDIIDPVGCFSADRIIYQEVDVRRPRDSPDRENRGIGRPVRSFLK